MQAVSCLVTALNLYNVHGRDFLYESSVEGILHVLRHLGQSPAYLGIVTGRSCPISQSSSLDGSHLSSQFTVFKGWYQHALMPKTQVHILSVAEAASLDSDVLGRA